MVEHSFGELNEEFLVENWFARHLRNLRFQTQDVVCYGSEIGRLLSAQAIPSKQLASKAA